jgi:hypothetical protein
MLRWWQDSGATRGFSTLVTAPTNSAVETICRALDEFDVRHVKITKDNR